MITDMLFEGARSLFPSPTENGFLPPASPAFCCPKMERRLKALSNARVTDAFGDIVSIFKSSSLLQALSHYHCPSQYILQKAYKGSLKPVRWDEPSIEAIESLGVKETGDFTWKQILDLFACTECGRCSDQCPAHAVGRPLSPMMVTIKLREAACQDQPVLDLAINL